MTLEVMNGHILFTLTSRVPQHGDFHSFRRPGWGAFNDVSAREAFAGLIVRARRIESYADRCNRHGRCSAVA
jgi:hypothetical protein